MRAGWLLLLSALYALSAQAAPPLPQAEAAAWLQKMADAARRTAYEGVFVVRQGDSMQTLSISNRPAGQSNESRLKAMDGSPREVRCSQTGAITVMADGGQLKVEKRLSRRHFPDLLPTDAQAMTNWYEVRLGEMARVAGLDCRNVELLPRDAFRWGYVLCAEKDSGLPLKAVLINAEHAPLMQYAFAEVRLGTAGTTMKPLARPARLPEMPEPARRVDTEHIVATTLPPGYARIAAVKRHLPKMADEVEHWVFSDGLTHISLFLSPSDRPVESVRGSSTHGMVNLMRRQVGAFQATVLGDAPWPAVESIAMGLEPK